MYLYNVLLTCGDLPTVVKFAIDREIPENVAVDGIEIKGYLNGMRVREMQVYPDLSNVPAGAYLNITDTAHQVWLIQVFGQAAGVARSVFTPRQILAGNVHALFTAYNDRKIAEQELKQFAETYYHENALQLPSAPVTDIATSADVADNKE